MFKWVEIKDGCEMPKVGDEVLVTVWMDSSYGEGTIIERKVDLATYSECHPYIKSSNNVGGFDTDYDWDEGQPIKVIAWASKPEPFTKNI